MKKTLIIGMVTFVAGLSSYGQGTVNFANAGASISNVLTMAPVVAGNTFNVALYWLPDQATPPTTADFLPNTVAKTTNFLAAGIVVGGTVRMEGITPAGGFGWFQVRAWETAYGSTYEDVLRSAPQGGRPGLAGTSNIIRVDTGDPTTVPAGTPGGLTPALKGFYVVPVPEPSVIGLGLLGIGALLLLRRRQ